MLATGRRFNWCSAKLASGTGDVQSFASQCTWTLWWMPRSKTRLCGTLVTSDKCQRKRRWAFVLQVRVERLRLRFLIGLRPKARRHFDVHFLFVFRFFTVADSDAHCHDLSRFRSSGYSKQKMYRTLPRHAGEKTIQIFSGKRKLLNKEKKLQNSGLGMSKWSGFYQLLAKTAGFMKSRATQDFRKCFVLFNLIFFYLQSVDNSFMRSYSRLNQSVLHFIFQKNHSHCFCEEVEKPLLQHVYLHKQHDRL